MARLRRPLAAFLVVAGASAALALLLAHASANKPSAAVRPAVTRLTHESVLEHQLGGADATEGGDSEAYTDRAYPGTEITQAEVQGAIRANAKLQKKGPKGSDKW
jgi:hypothetical protein